MYKFKKSGIFSPATTHPRWHIAGFSLPYIFPLAEYTDPVTHITSINDPVCYREAGDLQLCYAPTDRIFH